MTEPKQQEREIKSSIEKMLKDLNHFFLSDSAQRESCELLQLPEVHDQTLHEFELK